MSAGPWSVSGREPGVAALEPTAPGGRVLTADPDSGTAQVLTAPEVGGRATPRTVPMPAGGRWRPGDLVAPCGDAGWRRVYTHPTGSYPSADDEGWAFLRVPSRWARLAARAALSRETRAFFEARGFLEVETPIAAPSAGTELHLDPVEAVLRPGPGLDAVHWRLLTSPEPHMKRLLAAGAPPIFQLARVFRSGERGGRHRPEFTMLEWYRPWERLDALMDDCEAWLRHLAGGDRLTAGGLDVDLSGEWPRLRFSEALKTHAGVAHPEDLSPDAQLEAMATHVEPGLGHDRPVFVTDWPIAHASLARPKPGDPSVAERFELYVAGMELANAFGELTDPAEQRRRCVADNVARVADGRPAEPLDEPFLRALEEGLPPSCGIAVGFDRVVMLLTGAERIDDVLAF